MATQEQSRRDVDKALESALERCRRALADYRAGLLDEHELRHALFRDGLVQGPDEAWLLDLRAGRWWHYDGVVVGAAAEAVASPGVAPLQTVVDELVAHASASNEEGNQ